MKYSARFSSTLIVGAILSLLVSACSPAAPTKQDGPDLGATQAALKATQDALSAQQTDAAQLPVAAATDAPIPEPAATAAPTAAATVASSADQPFYVEEFSAPSASWTYALLRGEDADFELYTEADRLVFDITGENVWPYYSYNSFTYTNVRLDTRAENLGNNNNNVTLFCRANDRGWYEASVANSGLYAIYRYEYASGDFTVLYNGGVQNLRTGRDTNDFTLICAGDRITLAVNGVEVRTVEDSLFDSGLVGIGVSSFDDVPVHVEFDYVTISEP